MTISSAPQSGSIFPLLAWAGGNQFYWAILVNNEDLLALTLLRQLGFTARRWQNIQQHFGLQWAPTVVVLESSPFNAKDYLQVTLPSAPSSVDNTTISSNGSQLSVHPDAATSVFASQVTFLKFLRLVIDPITPWWQVSGKMTLAYTAGQPVAVTLEAELTFDTYEAAGWLLTPKSSPKLVVRGQDKLEMLGHTLTGAMDLKVAEGLWLTAQDFQVSLAWVVAEISRLENPYACISLQGCNLLLSADRVDIKPQTHSLANLEMPMATALTQELSRLLPVAQADKLEEMRLAAFRLKSVGLTAVTFGPNSFDLGKLLESATKEFEDQARLVMKGLVARLGALLPDEAVRFCLEPKAWSIHGQEIHLDVEVSAEVKDAGELRFNTKVALELETLRLTTECAAGLVLRPAKSGFDLGVLSMHLVEQDDPLGYLDFVNQTLSVSDGIELKLCVPGLPQEDVDDANKRKLRLHLRFSMPPSHALTANLVTGEEPPRFTLLSRAGINLHSELEAAAAAVMQGLREVFLDPDTSSQLEIVQNAIVRGELRCQMALPGLDSLVSEVTVRVHTDGGQLALACDIPPEKINKAVSDNLKVGTFSLSPGEFKELGLKWLPVDNQWDLVVKLSATLKPSLLKSLPAMGDFAESATVHVESLDLVKFNGEDLQVDLLLSKPVVFSVLNSMLEVGFYTRVTIARKNHTLTLSCEEIRFKFQGPDALTVKVDVGNLDLEFGDEPKIKWPTSIGLQVIVGDSLDFFGQMSYQTGDEQFFLACGQVTAKGFPGFSALLKLGTGKKEDGSICPNIAIYGSVAGLNSQVFSGVTVREIGGGVGINNRLTGLGSRPSPEAILPVFNQINPASAKGWEFVRERGFYCSIVLSAVISASPAPTSTVQPYVASLLLSLDTNLSVVALGKLWLTSSVDWIRKADHYDRAPLVGALVLDPRACSLAARFESRPNPAVEAGGVIKDIFSAGSIALSLRLNPSVVDFHLEKVTYNAVFLGVLMHFEGSYRLAMARGNFLTRAALSVRGEVQKDFSTDGGGVRFWGNLYAAMEFGGLLGVDGVAAYAILDSRIEVGFSAYIEISFTIETFWDDYSWSERFGLSGSQQLGLYGAVGFDGSGKAGFSVVGSFAVCIFGYDLELSVPVQAATEVIDSVKSRVAEFERSLAPPPFLRGLAVRFPATNVEPEDSVSALTEEKWKLHSRKFPGGVLHLLVPQPDGDWIAPELKGTSVPRLVTGLSYQVTGKPLVTLEPPWAVEHPGPSALRIRATMFESAALPGQGKPVVAEPDPLIITDPRYLPGIREFEYEEDQALRPDWAPALDMAPLAYTEQFCDLVLGKVLSKKPLNPYEQAVLFVESRRTALLDGLIRGQDDPAPWGRARAALLRDMLEDFERPEPTRYTGWIFQLADGEELESISIRRADHPDTWVPVYTQSELVGDPEPLFPVLSPRHAVKGAPEHERLVLGLPVDWSKVPNLLATLSNLSHFRIQRLLPWESNWREVASRVEPEQLFRRLSVNEEQIPAVILPPFLFREEVPVPDGKASAFHGQSVKYRVEAVGFTEPFPRFSSEAPIYAPSDPFRGRRFSVACSATSLYPGQAVRFTLLCQTEGDDFEHGGAFLDSLELYCEEVPLQQAGRNPVEPAQPASEFAPTLQSMSARRPLHLAANKRRLEFSAQGDGRFTIARSQLGPRSGYRFFIRPGRQDSPMTPCVELPLAYVREIWASPHSTLNPMASLELVPAEAIAAILYQQFSFQPATLAYFPVPGQSLTRFELEWGPAADEPALDGGVEIELRDFDDPGVSHVMRFETFELTAWQQVFRDFGNLNDWSRSQGPLVKVPFPVSFPEAPARFYLPTRSREYDGFLAAGAELSEAAIHKSWTELLRKYYSWEQAAGGVARFLDRCPGVSEWLASMRQAVATGIRLIVLGARVDDLTAAVNAGDASLLGFLAKREAAILEVLRSVETARVQPGDGPTGVLDLNVLAKPAARILRRRSNLALHALDPEVVSRLPADDGRYPAGSRLRALRARLDALGNQSLPRARAVMNDACDDQSDGLQAAIKELVLRIGKGLPVRGPSPPGPGEPDFARDLQKGLVWSPGLEQAIALLEAELGPIQRRPHHSLGSDPVELEELLPRWMRVHTEPLKDASPTAEDQLDCYLSLHLLWERLGLAVDLGTQDPGAMERGLVSLSDKLRETDLNVSWLQPVEASLVAGRNDYLGYAFVRVAVVPLRFYQDLADENFFRDWVAPRGVLRGDFTRDDKTLALVQHFWRQSVLGGDGLIPCGKERVQPRRREWTAAPTQGGNCRASFYLSDLEGHRFRMRLRRVFRHESLISWLEDRYPSLKVDEQEFGPPFHIPGRTKVGQSEDLICSASSLPHPDLLCYIYRLPAAGIRALLSQIAQVRTGFEGVDLQFSFALKEPDKTKHPLADVLKKLEASQTWRGAGTAVEVTRKPAGFSEPFLFRHERMLRLPHHRYYLNYQLEARGQFGGVRAASARAEASVKPKKLALYPSQLEPGRQLEKVWTLPLTRFTDNLCDQEQKNGLPVLEAGGFRVDCLPDLEMQYGLYVPTIASPTLLRALLDVLMPWNPEYPSTEAYEGQPHIRSADAGVTITRATPALYDSTRTWFWIEVTFTVTAALSEAVVWSTPVVVATRPEFAEKVLWKVGQ